MPQRAKNLSFKLTKDICVYIYIYKIIKKNLPQRFGLMPNNTKKISKLSNLSPKYKR